jgi:5-methylcytosine-specific restriction endonuclease McrA
MLRKSKYKNPRDNKVYNKLRKEVIKRDKYKCQYPGCENKKQLQIHHIVRWSDSGYGRYNPLNLITICKSCHKNKVTNNEHIYKKLFLEIVYRNQNNGKN